MITNPRPCGRVRVFVDVNLILINHFQHRTWNGTLFAANADILGFVFQLKYLSNCHAVFFVARGLAIRCVFWHLVNHRSAILIPQIHPAFCWIHQVCLESSSLSCRRLREGHVSRNCHHYLITTFAFVHCAAQTNYVLFTNSIYLFGFHYLSYFRSAWSLHRFKNTLNLKNLRFYFLFLHWLTCDIKLI